MPGGPEGGLVLLGEVRQLEALPRQLLRVQRQAAHTHLAVSAAADLLDALRGMIVAGLARFLAWPVDQICCTGRESQKKLSQVV